MPRATCHVHATEIPFMGLASLVANRASKGGVSGLHVAEFEHFSATVDGNELTGMVEKKLGSDWQRMIRERGKKGTELTLIYIHPEGARMGIFVFALDGHELEVVQASIDPDSLSRTIAQYDHEDDKTMTDKDVSE